MVQTFNAYIVYARAKHLIYMLDNFKTIVMERKIMKRALKENFVDDICPRTRTK